MVPPQRRGRAISGWQRGQPDDQGSVWSRASSSVPQRGQHQISTLANVSGGEKGPWGLRLPSHGVWDLPKPGTGTRSSHWPSFETGITLFCKRRADATPKHCALNGCGFGRGPALGELILQGSQQAAALWGDPGHRPGRAGGRRQPGSPGNWGKARSILSLCSKSQAGITFGWGCQALWMHASGLLASFWRLYFIVLKRYFFFFFTNSILLSAQVKNLSTH